jgi:multidrug efflux pump subunit AcrB
MGLAISILSINGILALSGVVVNDSLLLVNQYNALRRSGQGVQQALIEAGSLRMRAIFLTSMTTVLGLVSLLGESSEQALFLIPAATSLAFGIAFATLISLILVPVVLLIAYDVKHAVQHRIMHKPLISVGEQL